MCACARRCVRGSADGRAAAHAGAYERLRVHVRACLSTCTPCLRVSARVCTCLRVDVSVRLGFGLAFPVSA
eukprot:775761-Pleurochrysis_carterae.AAC.1